VTVEAWTGATQPENGRSIGGAFGIVGRSPCTLNTRQTVDGVIGHFHHRNSVALDVRYQLPAMRAAV